MATAMNYYKYFITSMDFLFDGESTPTSIQPGYVSDIYIEKDFDDDMFPVFRLTVSLNTLTYFKVLENKTNVKVRLRMQKYKYDDNKQLVSKKDYFNEVFSFFLDEDTPFTDRDAYEKKQKIEKSDGNSINNYNRSLELYLFSSRNIMSSKKPINAVLSSASMTETIAYTLSSAGFNNILFSAPDNNTVYSEVVLPALTPVQTIEYLEQQYGIYRKGALLFFDIERTYMIDKNSKCTSYELQENTKTVFSIPKSTDGTSFFPGCYDDMNKSTFMINVAPSNLSCQSNSVINDQLVGNRIMSITPDGNIRTVDSTANQHGDGTYKIIKNKFNNEFLVYSMATRIQEQSKIITISVGDFDVNAFSPNKEFTFKFDDSRINQEYGGNYRLSSCKIYFKKSGEEYTVSGEGVFKKG